MQSGPADAESLPCALPGSPRMRYWQPAPALRGLISGYHLYAVRPAGEGLQDDVFQPAGPILRFTFGNQANWRVRPPGGEWLPVPPVALFGPTDGVTWSESGAGLTVGFGLLPRGWARLTGAAAGDWANRIADPLGGMRLDTAALFASLAACRSDDALPKLFDAAIAAAVARPTADDEVIAAFEKALLRVEVGRVSELAHAIGRSVRFTERLAYRAFGFPPKKLIRRARFLRSLHALGEADPTARARAIHFGYTDYSHFVRDAQSFLGMSPQAFLRHASPLLRQSLELRRQVLGAPAQALAVSLD